MIHTTDFDGIREIAETLVNANPGNLLDPEGYYLHLKGAYDIAKDTVERTLLENPDIPINTDEVVLAAGLHDIARPLRKSQLFHELRGARLIEDCGVELGIVDTTKDAYRLAQMIRSHGTLYERWVDPETEEARAEFEPIDISLLLPRTWQEAIVTFSDMMNLNGKKVDNIALRFQEMLVRYDNDPRYQEPQYQLEARAVRRGQARIYQLCERVEALASGCIEEGSISVYGFL